MGSQQWDLGVSGVLSDWGWAGGSTWGYWGCRGPKDGEEVFGVWGELLEAWEVLG